MLPTFLIIGAGRCGTTTLYSYLQEHPEVYLPANKRPEPHFFLKQAEYQKGLAYYRQRYFPVGGHWRAVGEASVSYLFDPLVPPRIHHDLPDVKLIVCLRNPIERAFSNYWHTRRSGLESLDFSEAIARETERTRALTGTLLEEVKPYSYTARGFYHEQLMRYLPLFGRSRIHVTLFDDLCCAPAEAVTRVFTFLGVDPLPAAGYRERVENRSVPEGSVIPAAERTWLADLFRADVTALGALLGRDLSHWLR